MKDSDRIRPGWIFSAFPFLHANLTVQSGINEARQSL